MTDTPTTPTFADRLKARFGDAVSSIAVEHGRAVLEVPAAHWLAVATALRDEDEFHFEQAMNLSGIDYLGYGEAEWSTNASSWNGFSRGATGLGPGRFDWVQRPVDVHQKERFAVVVQLLSVKHNRRIVLRCLCADDNLPRLPSLTGVWPGLNWFEREAFDLYGILFEGHPDLRRILTDYGFVGHPFRKDFPLIGNVEVRYDEDQKRVIYEPVTSVVPRVGVARVIRDDVDLDQARAEAADNWRNN
ncbi:MAG TPA: NADH-quinone oxidoreductase subunit C [Rhodanobacteraceae bacterium]|nr:NADH-quinone oxidoreductase subunit C [Rhodanobacteraceae bacterium]